MKTPPERGGAVHFGGEQFPSITLTEFRKIPERQNWLRGLAFWNRRAAK